MAFLLSAASGAIFVGGKDRFIHFTGLYIWKGARTADRNDPVVMKQRMLSVTVSTVIILGYTSVFIVKKYF